MQQQMQQQHQQQKQEQQEIYRQKHHHQQQEKPQMHPTTISATPAAHLVADLAVAAWALAAALAAAAPRLPLECAAAAAAASVALIARCSRRAPNLALAAAAIAALLAADAAVFLLVPLRVAAALAAVAAHAFAAAFAAAAARPLPVNARTAARVSAAIIVLAARVASATRAPPPSVLWAPLAAHAVVSSAILAACISFSLARSPLRLARAFLAAPVAPTPRLSIALLSHSAVSISWSFPSPATHIPHTHSAPSPSSQDPSNSSSSLALAETSSKLHSAVSSERKLGYDSRFRIGLGLSLGNFSANSSLPHPKNSPIEPKSTSSSKKSKLIPASIKSTTTQSASTKNNENDNHATPCHPTDHANANNFHSIGLRRVASCHHWIMAKCCALFRRKPSSPSTPPPPPKLSSLLQPKLVAFILELNGVIVRELPATQSTVAVQGLAPESHYRIRIWAISDGKGTRTPSNSVCFTTPSHITQDDSFRIQKTIDPSPPSCHPYPRPPVTASSTPSLSLLPSPPPSSPASARVASKFNALLSDMSTHKQVSATLSNSSHNLASQPARLLQSTAPAAADPDTDSSRTVRAPNPNLTVVPKLIPAFGIKENVPDINDSICNPQQPIDRHQAHLDNTVSETTHSPLAPSVTPVTNEFPKAPDQTTIPAPISLVCHHNKADLPTQTSQSETMRSDMIMHVAAAVEEPFSLAAAAMCNKNKLMPSRARKHPVDRAQLIVEYERLVTQHRQLISTLHASGDSLSQEELRLRSQITSLKETKRLIDSRRSELRIHTKQHEEAKRNAGVSKAKVDREIQSLERGRSRIHEQRVTFKTECAKNAERIEKLQELSSQQWQRYRVVTEGLESDIKDVRENLEAASKQHDTRKQLVDNLAAFKQKRCTVLDALERETSLLTLGSQSLQEQETQFSEQICKLSEDYIDLQKEHAHLQTTLREESKAKVALLQQLSQAKRDADRQNHAVNSRSSPAENAHSPRNTKSNSGHAIGLPASDSFTSLSSLFFFPHEAIHHEHHQYQLLQQQDPETHQILGSRSLRQGSFEETHSESTSPGDVKVGVPLKSPYGSGSGIGPDTIDDLMSNAFGDIRGGGKKISAHPRSFGIGSMIDGNTEDAGIFPQMRHDTSILDPLSFANHASMNATAMDIPAKHMSLSGSSFTSTTSAHSSVASSMSRSFPASTARLSSNKALSTMIVNIPVTSSLVDQYTHLQTQPLSQSFHQSQKHHQQHQQPLKYDNTNYKPGGRSYSAISSAFAFDAITGVAGPVLPNWQMDGLAISNVASVSNEGESERVDSDTIDSKTRS